MNTSSTEIDAKGRGPSSPLPTFRALASRPTQLSGNVWLTAEAYSDPSVASTVHLLVHATNRGSDTARVTVDGCPRIIRIYRESSGRRDLLWAFGEGTPRQCRLVKFPPEIPPGQTVVLPGWPDRIDLSSVELGVVRSGRYVMAVSEGLRAPRARSPELLAGESVVP